MPKRVSLIIPVYNEEAAVPLFLEAVAPVLAAEPYEFEFIFVNDGSRDRTLAVLLDMAQRDPRIRIIDLSRNFGKENALAAGLHAASGDAAIPMDADLQDPPELIAAFLRKWEEGFETVVGVRRSRDGDSPFKRRSARLFYRIFNDLSRCNLIPDAGDYRLLGRQALDTLNSLPERVRFTKGLYAWVGFPAAVVEYDRPARAAGRSAWNVWKLWNFALDGLTSFSTFPLRIWSYLGSAVALFGFGYAGWLAARTLLFGTDVPGYASLMVAVLTLGGLILLSLGVIGEYLGRIFEETKARPVYVERCRFGFPPSPAAGSGPKDAGRTNGPASPTTPQ